MSTSSFSLLTFGWVAMATGVAGLLALAFIILFFAVGRPYGTLNDGCIGLAAIPGHTVWSSPGSWSAPLWLLDRWLFQGYSAALMRGTPRLGTSCMSGRQAPWDGCCCIPSGAAAWAALSCSSELPCRSALSSLRSTGPALDGGLRAAQWGPVTEPTDRGRIVGSVDSVAWDARRN